MMIEMQLMMVLLMKLIETWTCDVWDIALMTWMMIGIWNCLTMTQVILMMKPMMKLIIAFETWMKMMIETSKMLAMMMKRTDWNYNSSHHRY